MSLVSFSSKWSQPQLPASLLHFNPPAWHHMELLARHEWFLSLPLPPQGLGSVICDCHCRDANESSFEVNWSQCGISWLLPSRGVNASPSEIKYPPLLFLAFPPFLSWTLSKPSPHWVSKSTSRPCLSPRHTRSIFTHLFEALAIPNWKKLSFSSTWFWHQQSQASSYFSFIILLFILLHTSLLPVLRYPVRCADPLLPSTDHFLTLFLHPWEKSI